MQPRQSTQFLRRHVPLLAEGEGELGDFVGRDLARSRWQQARIGLINLLGGKPLRARQAERIPPADPLHQPNALMARDADCQDGFLSRFLWPEPHLRRQHKAGGESPRHEAGNQKQRTFALLLR